MSGNTAEDAGVFVLHFALNDAMTKTSIVGCRRDSRAQFGCGIKGSLGQAERTKNLALAETIERFIGQSFEGYALIG